MSAQSEILQLPLAGLTVNSGLSGQALNELARRQGITLAIVEPPVHLPRRRGHGCGADETAQCPGKELRGAYRLEVVTTPLPAAR